MGVKRIVETDFWIDSLVVDNFTTEDRLFFLYLLTNPQSRQLGIYKINSKIAGFQTGFDKDVIEKLLDRFENVYHIIKYSKETNEVAIVNYLKYAVVSGGKPVEDLLKKDIAAVKNRELLFYVFGNVINSESSINTTVKKVIIQFLEEHKDEAYPYINYLNGNGNGNGSTCNVSCDESSNKKIKNSNKSKKHKYGEYNHVLLTDIEKEKLITEFGEPFMNECIKTLDEAIEMKGYKYKSHYLAIKKWVVDAVKNKGIMPIKVERREVYETIERHEDGIDF